jgi:transposase
MTKIREILRLASLNLTKTDIASSCGCARKTVRDILSRAEEHSITWPLSADVSDSDLANMLFPERSLQIGNRKYPDYKQIHEEYMRNGVTLKLLWTEYLGECRQSREIPLMYTQFCYYYQKYSDQNNVTMHIQRKPGDQIEVDWAGDTAFIINTDTGESIPCYIFVGVLNYSKYAYVEAFLDMKMQSWIRAHVHMYQYFGGSSRILTPDNLKTGVDKADLYTPELNKTYNEMAQHYQTAIIPARVKKPKDKPSAENTVRVAEMWILAVLRNQKFLSINELNGEIRRQLEIFNHKPFQKKEGSRHSIFLSEEKPFLTPLPSVPYELSWWKKATVQFNYHISVEKMQYSVPHEFAKREVDVRITDSMIEVFSTGQRICSHRRLYGYPGQYSTIEMHMPVEHQEYLHWNKDRFIKWAYKIGPNAAIVVKSIIASYKVEQQGYKACMGLLKLADKYSDIHLESSCERALSYTPHPSYKNVKNILVTGLYKCAKQGKLLKPAVDETENFGYTRGAGYYGGDKDDQ